MTCHLLNYLEGHRYILSVILSFLNEVDGTCLLITNTNWYRRILPIFEIPPDLLQVLTDDAGDIVSYSSHQDSCNNENTDNDKCIHLSSKLSRRKLRHRYIPMPIQCPWVLLDRLNCIRLKRRMQYFKKLAVQMEKDTLQPTNLHSFRLPYPTNKTTEEIAWYEWTRDRWHFIFLQHCRDISPSSSSTSISSSSCTSSSLSQLPTMPTKYELLRYRSPPSSSSSSSNTYDFKSPPQYFNTLLPPLTSKTTISMPPKMLPGVTLLASYPRSGNTLLRTLLERITGIVTGSDTRPDRTLSKALSTLHSLVGEGITSHSKACVVKTHFPERRGYIMYNAKRVILLVRNPFDAIDSYWNMCCTNTHTESVSEDVYERYRDKFRALALNEIGTWADFLRYWLLKCDTTLRNDTVQGETVGDHDCDNGQDGDDDKATGSGGPSILVVRFEDLVQNTERVMQEVIHFMTVEGPSMDSRSIHPFWKWRIRRALGIEYHMDALDGKDNYRHVKHHNVQPPSNLHVDTSKLGSYEPRSMNENDCNSSKRKHRSFGKSLMKNRYSAQDLSHMHDTVKNKVLYQSCGGEEEVNLLRLFGYDVLSQGFPSNFDKTIMQEDWSFIYPKGHKNVHSTIRVNQGDELRPVGSPYGRAMTRWRKSQTCDDTKPFELKGK